MGNFLQELKRRNVFRVGAAYVVVAWLVLQVIETVSDPLGLPAWTEAFFIVLLATGLPLILVFAWAFEITPEGLKKTRDVARDESVTAHTARKLNFTITAILALALAYFVWERQSLVEQAEPTVAAEEVATEVVQPATAGSVAVLPFVNMSADPEQEYFSDGISEELLNLLAKIPELRVPARTSSFQFKGQNLDIAEVARELNVKHVLEGSVRKADVRIRVTAQLIEADTGYHLWSDTYDRELTDIFAIQDEISAAIVDALADTLGIKAKVAPHVKAAANPEAYNAFLLGQHLIQKRTKTDIEAAIPNYERAIEFDPNYAPAHAGLGLAWYLLMEDDATYGDLPLQESLRRALPSIEKALELDPDLPEALGAMGLIEHVRWRPAEAIVYYEKALKINPSQTDIRNWYSSALDVVGRARESQEEIRLAYEMDPLSVLTLNNYAVDLLQRRQFDAADPVIDRLVQIDPARGAGFRADVLMGQMRFADAFVEMFRAIDMNPTADRLRGAAAFALANLGLTDDALQLWPGTDMSGIVAATGDDEYALELIRQVYEADPTDPGKTQELAWSYWNVDDREQALQYARRHLDLLDASVRQRSPANLMLALDAWQRGDNELAQTYLASLDTDARISSAAGVDTQWSNYFLAVLAYVNGNRAEAYDRFNRSLSIGFIPENAMNRTFKILRWNDEPDFVELRRRHLRHIAAEKRKFLDVACGPDGFVSWKPSGETCTSVDSI